MKKRTNLESWIEPLLWSARLVVIVPVVFSLLSVLVLFITGSKEILNGIFVGFQGYDKTKLYRSHQSYYYRY